MKYAGLATLAVGCSLLLGSAAAAQQLPQVVSGSKDLLRTNQALMITPQQAVTWAKMKAGLGPTYNGSAGGIQWMNFIISTAEEFGGVDPYIQTIPTSFYTMPDWPNAQTHIYGSGVEVEKLISNGTPVPVVASYGMTSGATPTGGLTAPMVYCPSTTSNTTSNVTTTCPGDITGKIIVCPLPPYPTASPGLNGPYSYPTAFLDNYTYTDGEVNNQDAPVANFPLYAAVPPTNQSSFYFRWNFSNMSACMAAAQKGNAAGMIWVYDISPGGAFGLIERSVYSAANSPSQGGPGTIYQNIPTLALDRVNGAKVVADAKNGATGTMWLLPTGVSDNCSSTASTANGSPSCGFVVTQGRYLVIYLPGKYYGTPQDQWINLATHIDAMSLVEEDGALSMLSLMHYFSQIPQSQRPKTLEFWFDGRHFMPGAESAWSLYDYFSLFPQLGPNRVAYMSMEHLGGRNSRETGTPDGPIGADTYSYVNAPPQDGGDIDGLINIANNNQFLIDVVRTSCKDNDWFRCFGSSGGLQPGSQGGYQRTVRSALLKGSPGIGLAGDWPGNWTQEYSQYFTEAGTTGDVSTTTGAVPGFDEIYFTNEVGGLAEMAGKIMAQTNFVITADMGWGNLASGLLCTTVSICSTKPTTGQLPDSQFVTPATATTQRTQLVGQYQTAFQFVEQGQYTRAIDELRSLEHNVDSWILDPNQTALNTLINGQIQKLLALPPVYTHDFSGAGISDVLWRDNRGNVGMWLMNGTSIFKGQTIGNLGDNWSIVGQRDFTGNGQADILWRDTSGNVAVWFMNGTQVASTASLGNVPTNWSVAATGCFDGSGVGDIVWRDTAGDVAIWFMNGTKVAKVATIGNVTPDWVILGADMHGDIFWRNNTTGDVSLWVMNGTQVTKFVDLGVVPANLSFAGIGDFDGLGSFDVLWRDTSGNVTVWLMNGTTIRSTATVGKVPPGWSIAETGDFNGDGKSDILLTDKEGDVAVWFLDGSTITSTKVYGKMGASWNVAALNAD